MKPVSTLMLGAILLLGCSSEPSSAQPGAMDRLSAYDTIDACLYRETDPVGRQACIGEYRAACETLSDEGETMAGMMMCAGEEYEAWDRWLNEAYRDLRESLPETAVINLREAQRSWMAHRDQDCLFLSSLYAGGSMAGLENASCQTRKTAERAIELMHWDADYPPY
ncbi:lysozyme inhibitor LprI family protein [Maricaulis sp.]|uniref:lysozyme inhibitor LprI family protein n=1 Tax=Maricaulis sp. TaxID=1486257 RepID=UPI0025BBC5EC|nr:lysozyme inhibitor LprI family protein [Maricaulis sp.]